MKFENTEVFNFNGAIRGMRNPLESWHKSDSHTVKYKGAITSYHIGENDLALAQRLILAGNEHSKFMRQIFVSVDITAPLYWWSEMDTYKIGTVANSTSTMHKIMSKPFQPDMFELNGIRGYKKEVIQKPNKIDEDTEEWKEYPINPNFIVSNQGRVKRKQIITTHNRIWKERILTNTLTPDNYLKVGIKENGKQKDKRVHRLVAITFIPNPLNLPEVNHKNGNKLDNRVENLEWCTRSNNQQHAVDHKLQPVPIYTYKGKLSKEQRDEIIKRYNTEDISRMELAKLYNVSHTTISSILNNKYNYGEGYENEYETFLKTIDELNELRDEWLITKDKEVWKTVIQKLPRNWLQTRTVTLSYANLRNMYFQRRSHKLTEWSVDFVNWVRSLPYSKELITLEVEAK
jgi:predicted DNA-binding protein YlxM (UPF0122 family)